MPWSTRWDDLLNGEAMFDQTLLLIDLIDATIERLPTAPRFDTTRTTLEDFLVEIDPSSATVRPLDFYKIIKWFDVDFFELFFDATGSNLSTRYVDDAEVSSWENSDPLGPYTDVYTEASMLTKIGEASYLKATDLPTNAILDINNLWYLQRYSTINQLIWRIGDFFPHDTNRRTSFGKPSFAAAVSALNAAGWSAPGGPIVAQAFCNYDKSPSTEVWRAERFRCENDNIDSCDVNRDLVYYGYLFATTTGQANLNYENNDYTGDVEDTFFIFGSRSAQTGDSIDFKVGDFGDYTGVIDPETFGADSSIGWEHFPIGSLGGDTFETAFVEKYDVVNGFEYVA